MDDKTLYDLSQLAVAFAWMFTTALWLYGERLSRMITDILPCYAVGDRVLTDFGRGVVVDVVDAGGRNWTCRHYYWVAIRGCDKAALLAGHELTRMPRGKTTESV